MYEQWEDVQFKENEVEFQDTRATTLGIIEFVAAPIKPFIADLYWIKTTTINADEVFELKKKQYEGLPKLMLGEAAGRSAKDDRDLYDMLSMVAQLDPTFEYAYYYGAHLLAWDGQYTLSISLLDKGLRNNPESSMMASSLSFLHYYFMKDWELGAYYAEMSYRLSGKLAAMPKAVAKLYAAGHDYDMAITFLADILESTEDEDAHEQISSQIMFLAVERDIELLEKAVEKYKKRNGRPPGSVQELVSGGIINAIPPEPFGGRYVIKENGSIENEPQMRLDSYKKARDYVETAPDGGRMRI